VNHFHKKIDILPLTNPTLTYAEMEFRPLQRGNEETVPTYLCWVDVSGGANLRVITRVIVIVNEIIIKNQVI
jgi:hypothetical protein